MEHHPSAEAPQMHRAPDGTTRPETEEERIARVKEREAIRARLTKIQATADKYRMTAEERADLLRSQIGEEPFTDYRPGDLVTYTDFTEEEHAARVCGRDGDNILIQTLSDDLAERGHPFYTPARQLRMHKADPENRPADPDAEELLAGIIDNRPPRFLSGGPVPFVNGLDEYQRRAATTAVYEGHGTGSAEALVYTLGNLAAEGAEAMGKYAKYLRKEGRFPDLSTMSPEQREAVALEIGDALWQAALSAKELGYTLSEVAQMNLDKLQGRRDRGTIVGSGDNR